MEAGLTSTMRGDHRSVKGRSGPPLSVMISGARPGHSQPHALRKYGRKTLKAKIVITPNPFLYALPRVSHVHKRKRAVGQTPLFIHSFDKHLSLIRGLLFPARDRACLSGCTEHSIAQGPPSCLAEQDHITTGNERLSDQHSNGGSAFVNTGKKANMARSALKLRWEW